MDKDKIREILENIKPNPYAVLWYDGQLAIGEADVHEWLRQLLDEIDKLRSEQISSAVPKWCAEKFEAQAKEIEQLKEENDKLQKKNENIVRLNNKNLETQQIKRNQLQAEKEALVAENARLFNENVDLQADKAEAINAFKRIISDIPYSDTPSKDAVRIARAAMERMENQDKT